MRPLNKVKIKWSSEFAYAIGLLTTDGNLSIDGRHINFTSKDKDLINTFKTCLGLRNATGRKTGGSDKKTKCFQVQFGDIVFYRYLLSLGLGPRKSKVIGEMRIPQGYFFDFLRGHFDGDGTFYSYWDPRWRSSFMFYLVFISASKNHIFWIRRQIFKRLAIRGHVTHGKSSVYQLKYAKRESVKLLKKIYNSKKAVCLERKRLKIKKALAIIGLTL